MTRLAAITLPADRYSWNGRKRTFAAGLDLAKPVEETRNKRIFAADEWGSAMKRNISSGFVFTVITAMLSLPASAQAVRLPIAEGVWVKTDTTCAAATNVYIYKNGRFGSVYFYGPKQSMGPANEIEVLSKVGRGRNGFGVVNDGPIEVASRPNGQAAVQAYSRSEGVQWTEVVRLCAPATLSTRLRAALARLGLA